MPPAKKVTVEVAGRTLAISNLDKVLFPEVGFTKAQVIDYYARIAPTLVPHIGDRGITLRRYPDGVTGQSFFEKRCPSHRPEWIDTYLGPGDRSGNIGYCALDEPAAIVWAANMAALELHAPMARGRDVETPTMVVFDLDPGPGTGMTECATIGSLIRDVLGGIGLRSFAKTSGSKGLQVYVPLNTPATHEGASAFAHTVAQVLEKNHPKLIVTTQAKEARRNRVLIDWSQNSRHKTTVAVYSLRARPEPTVSTPVTWEEVDAAADGGPLRFETADVLARVEEHGDLFAPTLTLEQHLPDAAR